MNDVQRLKNLKVGQDDMVIVRPDKENWYDILEVSIELKQAGLSIIILDRFSSNISIVSEKTMNQMGWYRNE